MTSTDKNGASQIEGIIALSLAAVMSRTVAPTLRQLVWLAAAVFAAVTGIIFLIVSSYLALTTSLAPHWAAAIVGGASVGFAVLLWAAGYLRRAMTAARQPAHSADSQGLSPVIDAVVREIKASPKEAAAIALALGVVTGSSPDFRRSIQQLLDR